MKKTKHISFLLFISLAITVFFACKKTPDHPPVNVTTAGGILTIAQLRNMFNGSNIHFTQDISLYATVTMTDNYKTLYIRDNTGAIALRQLTAHGIYEGDSLRINLKGSWLDMSGTLSSLQIDSVDVSSSPNNKVVKIAVGKEHSPMNVTLLQLNSAASDITYTTPTGSVVLPQSIYDGQLVEIDNVQFAYTDNSLFIPANAINTGLVYSTHAIYDCGALNTIGLSLYTGTADFLYKSVPNTKSGSIIGAISFYNNVVQITPRSYSDLKFTQDRCGVDTLTANFVNCTGGVTGSTFATAVPGWYDINYKGYNYWTGNGSNPPGGYPSATSYGGQGGPSGNVMWLISPPVQNNPTKNLNFQTAVSFATSTHPQQLSVWVSTNFNSINIGGPNHPLTTGQTQATWTEITSAFPNIVNSLPANTFAFASPTPVMLSNYLPAGYTGTFYIGFRYVGNQIDSTQTFAINNVVIKN
ncbi:MAG TPA: DUF5689 domain-containing protein [Bacteroidia bacterium]|jgi:hypothetical protein|nr:DUF5689 domain-containing protein [Bacteroidia bacterium]